MAFSLTPAKSKAEKDLKDAAWAKFRRRFPGANSSRFSTESYFDKKGNVTVDLLYDGHSVFDAEGETLFSAYIPESMRKALCVSTGFPLALIVNPATKHPIPATPFSESLQSLQGALTSIQIYITPSAFFTTEFREVFVETKIQQSSGHESTKWLAGPNMSYWPQQLNFALWGATTGCGVSRRILFQEDTDCNGTRVPLSLLAITSQLFPIGSRGLPYIGLVCVILYRPSQKFDGIHYCCCKTQNRSV